MATMTHHLSSAQLNKTVSNFSCSATLVVVFYSTNCDNLALSFKLKLLLNLFSLSNGTCFSDFI